MTFGDTTGGLATDRTAEKVVYKKITIRLIPFLFVCQVMAALDRLNIGYAQLQMRQDLGFSDLVYGVGASMFFVAYFFFEVPSNLMMDRMGARKVITRIMFCWGLVSAGTLFVTTPWHFYVARFLLGVFEAGFVPGILLYLTYWYPQRYRGRIAAAFFAAVIVAGLVGGPLSGWILSEMDEVAGLQGWQWMFLIEGLPSTLLGVIAWFYLTDRPAVAHWLTEQERRRVLDDIEADRAISTGIEHGGMGRVFRDSRVWVLAFVYFCLLSGGYTLTYWLPLLIADLGVRDLKSIGTLSAVPYLAGLVMMIAYSVHSDARRERRWHYCTAMWISGAMLVISATTSGTLVYSLVVLTVCGAFIAAALPVFWTVPPAYLSERGTPSGLAFITSVGQLGGIVAGALIGWLRETTGSMAPGLLAIAAMLCIAGLLMVVCIPAQLLHERQRAHESGGG